MNSLDIKKVDIVSELQIYPICHKGYLFHGFRINTLECDNCNEVFDMNNISVKVN